MNSSTRIGTQEQRYMPCLNEEAHNYHAEEPTLTVSVINELYEARDRLRNFAAQISYNINTPIREDVVRHCDKIKNLRKQVYTYGQIESMVKYRIQKIIKNKRIKRNWGQEDISILIWVVSKYADHFRIRNVEKELDENSWVEICQLIPGVKAQGCMFKWLSLKRNKLADHAWSQKESLLLDQLVSQYGDDWAKISELLYFKTKSSVKVYRCPKQCREHWNCYLNPELRKGHWSVDEDFILLTQIRKRNGQKRWTELTQFLRGRTQNALKNRYNLIIEKQKGSKKYLKTLSVKQELQLAYSYLSKQCSQKFAIYICQQRAKQIQNSTSFKNQEIKMEDLNQNYSIRNLGKKKAKYKINDLQRDIDQGSNYFNSTPKIFENHIIQMNSLDCTPPIFMTSCPKLMSDQDILYPNRQVPDLCQDIQRQAIAEQPALIEECSQLNVRSQKIHVISIGQNNIVMLAQLMKNMDTNGCSFVPCKLNGENKLTKLNY